MDKLLDELKEDTKAVLMEMFSGAGRGHNVMRRCCKDKSESDCFEGCMNPDGICSGKCDEARTICDTRFTSQR